MTTPVLHGYWRSGTAYRVRIALALKGVAVEQVTHDLRQGAQHDPAYAALNPQPLVPALDMGGGTVLTQSPAILEWIEERHPDPPLLPADPAGRAIVRGMAALIGCDIHPLQNLRVLTALRTDFAADDAAVQRWIARWIGDGLAALDILIGRHGGGFAYGAAPTLADRYGIDCSGWPNSVAAGARARALPAFAATHPDCQPDADRP